jgi:hypothetical protein
MAEDKLRRRLKSFFRKDASGKSFLTNKEEESGSPSPSVHSADLPIRTTTSDSRTQPAANQLTPDVEHGEISLWDKAYDSLRNDKPELVSLYEDLLSRVLNNG